MAADQTEGTLVLNARSSVNRLSSRALRQHTASHTSVAATPVATTRVCGRRFWELVCVPGTLTRIESMHFACVSGPSVSSCAPAQNCETAIVQMRSRKGIFLRDRSGVARPQN
jgi:hypothetical protein